jgi:hypothetical protein
MRDRRDFLLTTGGAALAASLSSFKRAMAQDEETAGPDDPFILLLKGIYEPVSQAPDLGLPPTINLSDGTYSKTRIYPVFGLDGVTGTRKRKAIGDFYVQGAAPGTYCAYDLPGGALAMQFLSGSFTPHDDGAGGQYLEATFELTIVAATGIYQDFANGHNHMVDRAHLLADGSFDEFCFCVISQYPFP